MPINMGSETHDFDSLIRFVVTIYIDISCPFKTWIIVKFFFNNLGNERNLMIES